MNEVDREHDGGRREQPKEAPHKKQGPKQRYRVRAKAEGAPFMILDVDATDEENAKDQWHATNGPGFDGAELAVARVEPSAQAVPHHGGRR